MQVEVREGEYCVASTGGDRITIEITIDGKVYRVSEDLKRLVVETDSGTMSAEPLLPNKIRVRAA